eukprot:9140711-Alexandrium_andersonii.AAC.1
MSPAVIRPRWSSDPSVQGGCQHVLLVASDAALAHGRAAPDADAVRRAPHARALREATATRGLPLR